MSQNYLLRFSKDEKTIQSGNTQLTVAAIQKSVLKELLSVQFTHTKKLSDVSALIDFDKTLDKSLKSGDSTIQITDQQRNFLIQGFEYSAGSRPPSWLTYCSDILIQLKDPKTIISETGSYDKP